MINNKEPIDLIIGICHGETEKIFLKPIIENYLKYKYEEIFEMGDYDYNFPKVIIECGTTSIQFNSLVKNSSPIFDGNFIKKNFDSNKDFLSKKVFFIILLDKNEKDQLPELEKRIIETNAKTEINEILENIYKDSDYNFKEIFFGSKVIFFNKGIEKNLKHYSLIDGKKKSSMHRWIKENEKKWKSSDDIKKNSYLP